MAETKVLLAGHGLVESPRWHDGRLWFADWTAGAILKLGDNGRAEVAAHAAAPPLSFDFALDGTMLVVASGASHLMRRGADGLLAPFADFGAGGGWNENVGDGRGHVYATRP